MIRHTTYWTLAKEAAWVSHLAQLLFREVILGRWELRTLSNRTHEHKYVVKTRDERNGIAARAWNKDHKY